MKQKIYHVEHSIDAFPACWDETQRASNEKFLTALFPHEVNCRECVRIMAGVLDAF